MKCDEDEKAGPLNSSAVNSIILDYYKKFGRKRDLEQYFSLSTAQGEVRDPTGTFWKNMKVHSDSSDSGGKKSESSRELCRISIKCSVPDPSSSQDENSKSKTEPVSPPIIAEDFAVDVSRSTSRCTDDDTGKSGDDNSQKSLDVLQDTSINKPLSPSSSITSQRKLEWDSLADVGYANESDRKTSASSLSTLERLALKQQYSNNETRQNLGHPTAHSTPLDENQGDNKSRKCVGKNSTNIYKRDVELVELNVPQNSQNQFSQAINVHLTKHISFSVDKNGELRVENIKKDLDVSPHKASIDTEMIPQVKMDKEIQTTLNRIKETSSVKEAQCTQKTPILMSVNTLKMKNKRRKLRLAQKKARNKKRMPIENESINVHERSGDQLSEADSFEYMPGHIYNQNQLKLNNSIPNKVISNKSSLESSGALTTDSSKGSKHSFTKDLEKSIELLKAALQQRYDDNLKKKLVKYIIQRLLKSKYRDDDSTTDFLSGISFGSKKIGLEHSNTTSTHTSGDGNDIEEKKKLSKPKKSILRMDKFNANAIASTSQSAPNLPIATCSDKPIVSKLKHLTSSNTDSDISGGEKVSSSSIIARISSEELYRKYLDALRREEAYKKHLKEKEIFLKQKLASSDSAFKIPKKPDEKMNSRLKDLMSDLIRNNYDDGSGDASKLEGGSDTNVNYDSPNVKNQRSHSVFTLSSCNSDSQSKKPNLKKQLQNDVKDLSKPGSSKEYSHYCCCPHHSVNNKSGVTDSSVQVNIKEHVNSSNKNQNVNVSVTKKCLTCDTGFTQNMAQIFSDHQTGDIKYVCLCSAKDLSQDVCDDFLVYKCSRLTDKSVLSGKNPKLESEAINVRSGNNCACKHINIESHASAAKNDYDINKTLFIGETVGSDIGQLKKVSKSSQTNLLLNILAQKPSDRSIASSTSDIKKGFSSLNSPTLEMDCTDRKVLIHEATRCIQTEISINPQISDPSLPDINIINDTESVKFISEQVKQVSKRNLVDDICNRDDDNDYDMCKKNSKKMVTSTEKVDAAVNKEVQNEVKDNDYLVSQSVDNNVQLDITDVNNTNIITDNFTIPIQGTNMKLMVSIGSNDRRISGLSKLDSIKPKEGLTEKSDYSQESTSAGEESCKSVQYQAHRIKASSVNTNSPQHYTDHNSNKVTNSKHTKGQFQQFNKSCYDNINALKFNTYSVNENKLLMCSNTDTESLETCTQTDNVHKKDVVTKHLHEFVDTDAIMTTETCSLQISDNKNSVETPKEVTTRDTETQSDIVQTKLCVEPTKNLESSQADKKYTLSKFIGRNNAQVEKADIFPHSNQLVSQTQISPEIQPKYNSEVYMDTTERSKSSNDEDLEQFISYIPDTKKGNQSVCGKTKDPILGIIKDLTKRYSKDDIEKNKRKKCFKEIVTVLNYLLDTDDSTDREQCKPTCSCTSGHNIIPETIKPLTKISESCQTTNQVNKGVQMSAKKSKNKLCNTESSDLPTSTDLPGTSSDSATCKVLNKIKKECDRYHQKRCKSHGGGKKCDASSSTSANCNQCNKIHHCSCRLHKCKTHKSKSNVDKAQKKSVAYNLIIQTSESMISEETICSNSRRPLQNIIVRVPSRRNVGCVPFRELESKIEKKLSRCNPQCDLKSHRSRSCPNGSDISSVDDCARRTQECTVKEYLEINRPDFIEKCSQRQDCLKVINKSRDKDPCSSPRLKMVVVHTPNCMGSVANGNMYCGGVPMTYNPCFDPCTQTIQSEVTRIANERAVNRELLSAHVDRESPLSALNVEELRQLAREIGIVPTNQKCTPKFLSERDMKKHSEKIYKSLPEVTLKKEQLKKDNIKKTNLLMASIFKKNLQKKTLRGSVNLSNYSTVIKI